MRLIEAFLRKNFKLNVYVWIEEKGKALLKQ